jgi:chemotaxis protein MotB
MSHKRARKVHEEEHVNHERWMVTYADMVTLLMVLFIVMFAISQVDQRKFAALSTGLAEGFGAATPVLPGEPSVLDNSGIAPPAVDIGPQLAATSVSVGGQVDKNASDAAKAAAAKAAKLTVDRATAAAMAKAVGEHKSLDKARKKITEALKKAGLLGKARLKLDEQGLTVSLLTDTVFFAADSATLEPGGQRLLDAVAPALRTLPNPIDVQGNTNTVPVAPKNYPTEWELSTARAVTVARYLIEHKDLNPKHLTASGLADQHPMLPRSDPRADTVNRRVDLVVRSAMTAAQRALIAKAGQAADGTTDTTG